MSGLEDRRGSQRLAQLLEDEGALATATDEDRILAQLAAALREVPTDVPPMRQEFRDELRASVLQAARDQHSEPVLLTRLRDGARRMRYSTAALTGATTAAMALSGGGVALAAEHAQPDDLLYDVKLALEDLRLTLTFDQVDRGERAMSYAFDRLEEARTAARAGTDAHAATALYGAAERITEGSTALLDSGLVDPVVGLAGDLSAQVAILEQLRPDLGAEGTEAADAVMAAIIEATEGVLQIIDVSQWPGSDVPTLPDLAVPQQTPEATATPAPGMTTPPVGASTPGGTPSATDIESTGDPLLPGLDLPDVPLPGVPLPGVPVPGVPVPQPGEPLPIDPDIPGPGITDPGEDGPGLDDPVDDAGDGIGDVIDEVEDAVDDLGDGAGDAVDDGADEVVPDPVQSALPDPVEEAVEDVPSTIDDVVDTIPEVSDPVTEAVDEVEDAVDGLLPGLGSG